MVSHEASLTGAPKIALNLVRQFREKTNVELTTILHEGGPLQAEFEKVSDTVCLDVPREHHPKIHTTIRKMIKPWQKAGRDVVCICNSVESRFIANSLYTRGIPILFLLHEFPTSYEPGEFAKVYQYSQKMVFPCKAVHDAANELIAIPSGKSAIHPQGLLDDAFGTRIDKQDARVKLRKTLGLPADAFVVLGCGTIDLRKGIDHFLAISRIYESLNQGGRPVYFCWVGDGPRHKHSAYHYVDIDIAKSKQANIRMVGETSNVEPYFLGADSFLLTSRIDPFPCVVHEAMAAAMPVMVFDHSGGAVEAINDGAGLVLPFADYVAACRSIDRLHDNPQWARELGENARLRIRNDFRFKDYANGIIQLCEQEFGISLTKDSSYQRKNNRPIAA